MSELYTVEELACELKISKRTIYNQIGPKAKSKFPIKHKKIGRLVRFEKKEVDAFLNRQK